MTKITLGDFEKYVMKTIINSGNSSYGVQIQVDIKKVLKLNYSIPAIYTTLYRLEDKEFVKSVSHRPEPVRGGRAKTYYHVTPKGLKNLEVSMSRLVALGLI